MSRVRELLDKVGQFAAIGEIEEADLLLREALAVDPDDPMVWCIAGNLALNQRQLDLAERCFSEVLERATDDPVARLGQIAVTLLRHDYTSKTLAEVARTQDLHPGELILLLPLCRGDMTAILQILEERAVGDLWKRSGILAICYLVTRHFPLGLELSALLSTLPKVGLEELLNALFQRHAEEFSQKCAAQRNPIAVVNSQAKNVYLDYPIFAALRSAEKNVAYFMGETEASLELAKHSLDLDRTYLIHGQNLTEFDAELMLSTSPDAAELSPNSVKVLIPHDMSGHARVDDMDDAPYEAIPNYGVFDYYLCANETMLEDMRAFIPENDRALARSGRQPNVRPARKQRGLYRIVPKGSSNMRQYEAI